MKILESKEKLILTQEEKAILTKAYEILDDIYDEAEISGDIENFANEAKGNIEYLLDDAEVEGGEPKGAVRVVIIM